MLPLVAALVMVLIGCAGLTVDVRNGYVVHDMLQRAVDDGALSALRWSTQIDDIPGGPAAGIATAAVAEAILVAERELRSEGVAGVSTTSAALSGERLTVSARADVPIFFLRVFGLERWSLEAHAGAMMAPAGAALAGPGAEPGALGPALGALSPTLVVPDQGGAGISGVAASGAVSASGGTHDVAACDCGTISGDPQTARSLERMCSAQADPGGVAAASEAVGDVAEPSNTGGAESADDGSADDGSAGDGGGSGGGGAGGDGGGGGD